MVIFNKIDHPSTVHSVSAQKNPADVGTKPLSERPQLLLYILSFRNHDYGIGDDEYRQYSATATVRRLEKTFNRKGFFTAALFAVLTQRSEGTTVSKQERCVEGAITAAAEATAEAAGHSCSIALNSTEDGF